MNCDRVKKLIPIYLDNKHESEKMYAKIENAKNSVKEEAEFKAHLAECSSCKTEYDDMVRLIEILHDIPEENLPDDFTAKLHEKLVAIAEKNKDKTSAKIKKKIIWKDIYTNRYIKAFSAAAACVLIIFAVRILFGGVLSPKTTSNLVMDNKEAATVIATDNAQIAGSDAHSTVSEDNAGIAKNTFGEGSASSSAGSIGSEDSTGNARSASSEGTVSLIKENEQINDSIMQSEVSETNNNGEDVTELTESSNMEIMGILKRGSSDETNDETDNETESLAEPRTLMAESIKSKSVSQLYSGEDIRNKAMFSDKSRIMVTIFVANKAMEEETIRNIAAESEAIFINGETSAELVEKMVEEPLEESTAIESSEESAIAIIEFIITGSKYESFINNLLKNAENLNAVIEYSTPLLREDLEIKLNDYSEKLESINAQIYELENKDKTSGDDASSVTEPIDKELEELKLQKEEIEEQIDELIDTSEYTAVAVINIRK